MNLSKVPVIEVDAYYLPDTQGIDYRQNHVKTTIGITHIDIANKKMVYLRNAAKHFRKRANTNPIIDYQSAIASHQMQIIQGGQAAYHAYTFVAPSQLGASHELSSAFLSWLSQDYRDLAVAYKAFEAIAGLSKSLVLKLARVAHSVKPANLEDIFTDIAHQWEMADQALYHLLDPII